MSDLRATPILRADRAASYWLCQKPVVLAIIVFGCLYNGCMTLAPILQGRLLDGLQQGQPLSQTARVGTAFVLAVAAIQGARYGKRFYVRRFGNRANATMRLMSYHTILSRPASQLEKEDAGDLMARIISDVDLCVDGMRKVTTEIFDTGVLLVSYIVTLAAYDGRLTLLCCLFVPGAMLCAERMKGLITRYSAAYRQQSSRVAAVTLDCVDHALLYRLNGLEEQSYRRYDQALAEQQRRAVRAGVLENAMQPLYNAIAMLGVLPVIWLGGQKVVEGSWTVGSFSTYLVIFAAVAARASVAARLFNAYQKARVSWLRLKPYLGEYRPYAQPLPPPAPGGLRVEGLAFGYPGGEPLLQGLSFAAQAGQIIGITGPVASGKSALGTALLGLYPYGGSIKLAGTELRELSQAQRTGAIAYLGHQSQLFTASIEQNVALGRPGDVGAALSDACMDADLAAMPEGAQTTVGNAGVTLSGGQQARVGLARALLGHRRLIVLDDPFASVDMQTEERIIQNLRAHYGESVIVLISHRLHIFPMVDQVVLLQPGAAPQVGTHEELMAQSGLYREIYELQGEESHEEPR